MNLEFKGNIFFGFNINSIHHVQKGAATEKSDTVSCCCSQLTLQRHCEQQVHGLNFQL